MTSTTIDNIKVSPNEILREKHSINKKIKTMLSNIFLFLGAKEASQEVLKYGIPKQILLHHQIYEVINEELKYFVHTITPLYHCKPNHIELNWSDTVEKEGYTHIGVIAYDEQDFFIWMEMQDLNGHPHHRNKRIQQIKNTLYHCITTPDDLSTTFNKITKLNACNSNKYYSLIINQIKLTPNESTIN